MLEPLLSSLLSPLLTPLIPQPIPITQMDLISNLFLQRGVGPATFTRSTTGTFVDKDDGLVKTAAIDAARFEANGVLIEGASTNLLLRSEEFDNVAWTKSSGISVSANATLAPDGSLTADEITPSTGGTFIELNQNVTVDINKAYTQTYYIKENGFQFIQIIATSGSFGTFNVNFDLVNGVITQSNSGSSTGLNSSITGAANGFFKIIVTVDALANSSSGRLSVNFIKTGTTGRGVNEGDFNGTDSVFIWGAQLEELPFASSYIKTTTTSVTRTSDNLSISVANFNESEGSVSMDAETIGDFVGNQFFFSVDDGGITNRHTMLRNNSNNKYKVLIVDGGAVQADINETGTWSDNATRKLAYTYKTNEVISYVGGVSVGTDLSASMPTGMTSINIGRNQAGVEQAYGHIKKLKIFDVRLTPDQVPNV